MNSRNVPWIVAAVITAGVALTIAARVLDLGPNVTWVDLAALMATSFLAGLFIATPAWRRRVTR